jgi:hypothetical protein
MGIDDGGFDNEIRLIYQNKLPGGPFKITPDC